MPVAL